MGARFRSWWQQIKQHRVAIGVVAITLVVAIALIIMGYNIDGTGFNGYTITTITKTISGVAPPTNTTTTVYQPGKTIWDWLQLLIIPAVLAVAGFVINLTISRSEQEATKQRAQSEREAAEKRDKTAHELALNNQREDRLQTYLDRMSELLLTSSLRKSELNDDVRNIARARTLTVFSQLDRERKRTVLQFLYEANLISKNVTGNIVNLEHADISEGDYSLLTFREANLHQILMWDSNLQLADFRGADISDADLSRCELQNINLSGANLRETYIQNAKLADADLHNADLSKAHLRSSDLNNANLSGANLSGAHLGSLLNQDKSFYRRAANLTNVNLSNSILIDANLIEVNLTGANLREADLSRANLDKAKVSPEQLNTAKSLKGATMPDGSIHP